MHWTEERREEYGQRVVAIQSWARELGRAVADADFSIEIDGEMLAFIRTSHTVRIRGDAGEEAVVLSKEEFWNEYDLFERTAAPRLRAAMERLRLG